MPRKRMFIEPLTGAEKQRRYREKKKAEGKKRLWIDPVILTAAGAGPEGIEQNTQLREAIKAELKASWEPEVKAQRLEAARRKGRELAKRADHNFNSGRTIGICEAASFFISRDRVDISQHLIAYFMIEHEIAEAALQSDKRTKSLTLQAMEQAGVWRKPPPFIK